MLHLCREKGEQGIRVAKPQQYVSAGKDEAASCNRENIRLEISQTVSVRIFNSKLEIIILIFRIIGMSKKEYKAPDTY